MRFGIAGQVLGVVWIGLAGVLVVPSLFAVFAAEPWLPFARTALIALASGALMLLAFRRSDDAGLNHREAILTVTLVWFSVCAIGAIPFATHPGLQMGIVDASFESVSGFTTTGATVLSGLDALPHSVLLWRSITQWIGGMGMVIFGVAILPLLGVGGMGLYKAEAPGPTKDKMTPRIAETAKLLWVIYLGLSLLAGGLFYLQGMTAFDAVNHAMTGIATGGFSTHDLSLGYYDSASIRLVATGAMLVAGTSFAVLHRALTGELSWSEQPELRAYVGILCLATAVLTLNLWIQMPEQFPSLLSALGDAAFQAVSILTGTGYASADFDSWPPISHAVLFVLFFSGGMAGSTSGGVKVLRVMLLWRVAMLQFFKLAHRRGVAVVRLGAHTLDDRILLSSLGFIVMWLALLAVGTLALAAGGADPLTSLSAAAVSLANIGPGFGEVGPSRTFATLGSGSKLVLEALMILGRLEIYTVLVVLTPRFWRY